MWKEKKSQVDNPPSNFLFLDALAPTPVGCLVTHTFIFLLCRCLWIVDLGMSYIIPGLKFFKPSNTWSLRIFRAFGNALLLESFPKFCENPIVESATCARVIKYTMVWRDVSDLQYILQCCLDSFAGKRHFCGWWIHVANAKRFFNKTFSDVLGHVAGTYPLSHNPGIWAFKISSMKKIIFWHF